MNHLYGLTTGLLSCLRFYQPLSEFQTNHVGTRLVGGMC